MVQLARGRRPARAARAGARRAGRPGPTRDGHERRQLRPVVAAARRHGRVLSALGILSRRSSTPASATRARAQHRLDRRGAARPRLGRTLVRAARERSGERRRPRDIHVRSTARAVLRVGRLVDRAGRGARRRHARRARSRAIGSGTRSRSRGSSAHGARGEAARVRRTRHRALSRERSTGSGNGYRAGVGLEASNSSAMARQAPPDACVKRAAVLAPRSPRRGSGRSGRRAPRALGSPVDAILLLAVGLLGARSHKARAPALAVLRRSRAGGRAFSSLKMVELAGDQRRRLGCARTSAAVDARELRPSEPRPRAPGRLQGRWCPSTTAERTPGAQAAQPRRDASRSPPCAGVAAQVAHHPVARRA